MSLIILDQQRMADLAKVQTHVTQAIGEALYELGGFPNVSNLFA